MSNWDVIVIGLGGVGSSAAYHVAKLGQRVLGLEQFTPAHDRGSSHGETRIIRQAYFEHPSYVPLLKRAYDLWDQLEQETECDLFERTGLVEMGPATGVVVPGVLACAAEHQLTVQEWSRASVREKWPGLEGDPDWKFVVEHNAGFLRVESCVRAHLAMAVRAGATLRFEQPVVDWRISGDTVEVITDQGIERADQLVIAGGAWSEQLLSDLRIPLQILRKQLYWFEADEGQFGLEAGFPCFFHETPAGYFYGFPSIHGSGMKIARHSGGIPLERPQHCDQQDDEDRALCEAYLKKYLPGVSTRLLAQASCFYTSTPDENFIIDRHPKHSNVTLIAGLSGHGFKFSSVLGEIASQLAVGSIEPELELFQLDRF